MGNLVLILVVGMAPVSVIRAESVTLSCIDNTCRTCINDFKCYPRKFKSIRVQSNCPIAVCDDCCTDFILGLDGCPVCQCNGFSSREPCYSIADCQSTAIKCENYVCAYQPLSGSALTPGSSLFQNDVYKNNNDVYKNNNNNYLMQNPDADKQQPSFPNFPWLPNFPNLNNNNGGLFRG